MPGPVIPAAQPRQLGFDVAIAARELVDEAIRAGRLSAQPPPEAIALTARIVREATKRRNAHTPDGKL